MSKYAADLAEIKNNLVSQLNNPVLWNDSVKYLLDEGYDNFWEFGPGQVLTGLLRRSRVEAQLVNISFAKDLESL